MICTLPWPYQEPPVLYIALALNQAPTVPSSSVLCRQGLTGTSVHCLGLIGTSEFCRYIALALPGTPSSVHCRGLTRNPQFICQPVTKLLGTFHTFFHGDILHRDKRADVQGPHTRMFTCKFIAFLTCLMRPHSQKPFIN